MNLFFSPRLDNLTSCFTAAKGLVESIKNLPKEEGISLISLFDHEEIEVFQHKVLTPPSYLI